MGHWRADSARDIHVDMERFSMCLVLVLLNRGLFTTCHVISRNNGRKMSPAKQKLAIHKMVLLHKAGELCSLAATLVVIRMIGVTCKLKKIRELLKPEDQVSSMISAGSMRSSTSSCALLSSSCFSGSVLVCVGTLVLLVMSVGPSL
jgi:hypothetical protein